MEASRLPDEHRDAAAAVRAVVDALASVVHAERSTLELVVVALVAEGHVLIEDVPGVGKTLVARTLARAVDCSFSRLQFTPDLLPSDVTGTSVFDQRSASFTFRPGPVFAHLVLVDEINRASPRTQAALLECMEEGQVSADGETHVLARPFMVLATQNPVEHEGTFPLPEAQLDRFLLRVSLGYPPGAEEARMLSEQTSSNGLPLDALTPVCGAAELIDAAAAARAVHVEESLHRYVVSLLHHTRADQRLALGASPRSGVALVRAAKSLALLRGRAFATADDVRAVAPAVLEHRLLPEPGAGLEVTASAVADALASTPPP
jgi:MoxR-like ATPase